ncbi:MAG: RHS repeat protein [Prevotellaceae bacterium]|nr:RHS repeat protein [Candidatus Colivivens caballi]
MKKKKILLLAYILLASIQSGFAQLCRFNSAAGTSIIESQIISQSPNVAEMSRCVDRPVTYFNGTVDITIQLCEVQAEDITLPISLSYSSTGFRPSQEATWVGLGWSLSLNSCISRYIKCADDFLEYNLVRKGFATMQSGYYGEALYSKEQLTERVTAFSCPKCTLPCGHDVYVNELVVDVEPDIYSYSLWNGGDKFIITNNPTSPEQATFMDKAAGYKLRIYSYTSPYEGIGNTPLHYFELIDRNGTIYEFKKRELTYLYSYGNEASNNKNVVISGYETASHDKYASSWFLTKITTPKKHVIDFEYEDEDFDAISQESCVRYREISSICSGGNPEYMPGFYDSDDKFKVTQRPAVYSWSKAKIKTARLKNIKWDTGKICFASSPREDMYNSLIIEHTPQKLDRIDVFNSLDSLVHSYKFEYGYFGKNITNYQYNDCLYKRLKLKSIEDALTADYKYTFEYQDEYEDFPSKQTKSLDYWGYYNGINYGRLYYCEAFVDGTKLYEGAVKNSNETKAKMGMLTSIVHPTGNKETFTYESNRFLWPTKQQTGGEKICDLMSISVNKYNKSAQTKQFNINEKVRLSFTGRYHKAFAPNGYDSSCPYKTGQPLISIENILTGEKQTIEAPNNIGNTNWQSVQDDSIKASFVVAPGTYNITYFLPNDSWTVLWHIAEYDPKPVAYQMVDKETLGAGLRIKEIINDSGKTRRFHYKQLGKRLVDPILYQRKTILWILPIIGPVDNLNPPMDNYMPGIVEMPDDLSDDETVVNFECKTENCIIQFSESSVPLSTLAKGYELGYELVSEEVSDGHRAVVTEYKYENIKKEQRESPNPYQSTHPEFSNGLLQSKTIYDLELTSQDSKLVYSEEIQYQSSQSNKIPAYDFSYEFGLFEHQTYWFNWYSPWSITKTFDYGKSMEKFTYNYNNDLLPIRICQSLGCDTLVTDITYNTNCNDPVSVNMVNSNNIVPVKEISRMNGDIVSGKIKKYRQLSNSMFLPDKIFDIKLNASNTDDVQDLHKRVSYDEYDNNGNPLQVTRDGIPSIYIWGYSNEYPVAEISNMTYQDLLNLNYLTSVDITNIAKAKTLSDAHMQKLVGLKNCIATNRLCSSMTIYTYKPLVGITSQIAPNGLTTCYEYDSSGRLVQTSLKTADGNKQTLNKYKYNYKGVQK